MLEQSQRVAFVDEELGLVGDDAVLAHDVLEFADDFGAHYFCLAGSLSTRLISSLITSSSGRLGLVSTSLCQAASAPSRSPLPSRRAMPRMNRARGWVGSFERTVFNSPIASSTRSDCSHAPPRYERTLTSFG